MIKIQSFKQAVELYRTNKIPFNLLQEQAGVMLLEDDHTLKPNTITEAQIEQIANSPKGTEEYNG